MPCLPSDPQRIKPSFTNAYKPFVILSWFCPLQYYQSHLSCYSVTPNPIITLLIYINLGQRGYITYAYNSSSTFFDCLTFIYPLRLSSDIPSTRRLLVTLRLGYIFTLCISLPKSYHHLTLSFLCSQRAGNICHA